MKEEYNGQEKVRKVFKYLIKQCKKANNTLENINSGIKSGIVKYGEIRDSKNAYNELSYLCFDFFVNYLPDELEKKPELKKLIVDLLPKEDIWYTD